MSQTAQMKTRTLFRITLSRRMGMTDGNQKLLALWYTFPVTDPSSPPSPPVLAPWSWQFLSPQPIWGTWGTVQRSLFSHLQEDVVCLLGCGWVWELLQHRSYFWHRLFLPLHLEILLSQPQLWSKRSVAELHCHKTSKPTSAQLFSSPMPQHDPWEGARVRRAGLKFTQLH